MSLKYQWSESNGEGGGLKYQLMCLGRGEVKEVLVVVVNLIWCSWYQGTCLYMQYMFSYMYNLYY